MSTFSQPEDYSITLNDTMSDVDTLTLTSGSTITIDPSYSYHYSTAGAIGSGISISGAAGSTYTISGLSGNTVNTISSINISDFKINLPEEWVDCFPDFDRIEKMCEEYPGLKIAYEKFKTTYKLVADHYDTPKDKRPKP